MAPSSFANMVCLVAMCLVACTSAFVVSAPASRASALAARVAASSSALRTSPRCRRASWAIGASEEEVVEEAEAEAVAEVAQEVAQDPAQDATQSVKSFFAPNENVRLGASRDQDGKSNVWAVEPKMRVEGEDVENAEGEGISPVLAVIGVLVVAMSATIALLPAPDSI